MPDRDDDAPSTPPRHRGTIDEPDVPFKPRVRWVFWLPILVVIAAFIATYFVTEARRARRLRAQLISEHHLLTETLAPPYIDLRHKIEALVLSAVGPWQGTYTAPGFTFAQLTSEPVLYGRVRIGEVHNAQDAATSIQHRYPDQIAACLGIDTNWVHQVYFRGDFLMPSYVESVRNIDSGNRLQALRQDLQFRLRRDTPDIVAWTRRHYFVLAADEAALSIDGPTRVYVWDLRTMQPLARARGDSGSMMLIPVRISGIPGGGQPIQAPARRLTLSEHDCAVANIVREQLGVQVLTLHNAPDLSEPSASGDAGAGADAHTTRDASHD